MPRTHCAAPLGSGPFAPDAPPCPAQRVEGLTHQCRSDVAGEGPRSTGGLRAQHTLVAVAERAARVQDRIRRARVLDRPTQLGGELLDDDSLVDGAEHRVWIGSVGRPSVLPGDRVVEDQVGIPTAGAPPDGLAIVRRGGDVHDVRPRCGRDGRGTGFHHRRFEPDTRTRAVRAEHAGDALGVTARHAVGDDDQHVDVARGRAPIAEHRRSVQVHTGDDVGSNDTGDVAGETARERADDLGAVGHVGIVIRRHRLRRRLRRRCRVRRFRAPRRARPVSRADAGLCACCARC